MLEKQKYFKKNVGEKEMFKKKEMLEKQKY